MCTYCPAHRFAAKEQLLEGEHQLRHNTPTSVDIFLVPLSLPPRQRLEGLNKEYGTRIMISDATYKHVSSVFLCRPLDLVAVKGKTQPSKVYELVAHRSEATQVQVHTDEGKVCVCSAGGMVGDMRTCMCIAMRSEPTVPLGHQCTRQPSLVLRDSALDGKCRESRARTHTHTHCRRRQ